MSPSGNIFLLRHSSSRCFDLFLTRLKLFLFLFASVKLQSTAQRNCFSGELSRWFCEKTLRYSFAEPPRKFHPIIEPRRHLEPDMLPVLFLSLFGPATVHSAAVSLSPHLIMEAQLSPPPQNLSTATFDISPSLNSSRTLPVVDHRFTYSERFANLFLNKKSAYMNTVLALADLSTKGWTSKLAWEEQYSFVSYGDVIIRIHAGQNPSTLEYRHAIWGLYYAIRGTSANGFKACVSTLYWRQHVGARFEIIGYVSIIGESSVGIDRGTSGNATGEFLEPALPTQKVSPEPALTNLSTTTHNATSLATETTHIKVEISLLGKLIDIDAVFRTIYTAIIYLASMPQHQRIDEPGFIKDNISPTFLRWDSSYLTVQPAFEYRYAIAALADVVQYMYEQNQFEEARFVVYVYEIEVGRGLLYRTGPGGASSSD